MSIALLYKKAYCIFLIWEYFISGIKSIDVLTTPPPKVQDILERTNMSKIQLHLNASRRILYGSEVVQGRPYMVYLKLPPSSEKYHAFGRWLCGGVIIHDEYILTSAACIEDVKHFYVVSGTYKHSMDDDQYSNMCIKNGAKKAVWKCIPRNYVFDGHENDNLRWMNNDIAIVKVEDEFDFTRRIRGCDFIPKPVRYNNQTVRLERPGTEASIAGWGSVNKYSDWINRRKAAFPVNLLAANVVVISKSNCKQRWGARYHNIIDNYMICTKDTILDLSEVCQEKFTDCTDILYSDENMEGSRRVLNPESLILHSAYHNVTRRSRKPGSGGFCENDHGGPLIYGDGPDSIVIGIISACLVKERTNKCYGPFLYTSVYKNRMLINCAIYKDKDSLGDCSKLFRSNENKVEEVLSWADHPDGPAKSEIDSRRRTEDENGNIKQENDSYRLNDASSKGTGNYTESSKMYINKNN